MTENATKPLSVAIRTDGGASIGMGHVMRCIGLAQALKRRGHKLRFLLSNSDMAVYERIAHEGFTALGLKDGNVEATIEATQQTSTHLLIMDGYQFDQPWLEAIHNADITSLLWTDYLQAAHLPVDILLDQTPRATQTRYQSNTNASLIMTGLKYSVLRSEFLDGDIQRRKRTSVAQILVTMGGSDPAGLTSKMLKILGEIKPKAHICVVAGPANPALAEIKQAASVIKNCEVIAKTNNMAQLIDKTDLALCAAGASLWEFAYAGVPVVTASIAPNQDELGAAVGEHGAGIFLGLAQNLDMRAVKDELLSLLSRSTSLSSMSEAALSLVDGKGRERVADQLSSFFNGNTANHPMRKVYE